MNTVLSDFYLKIIKRLIRLTSASQQDVIASLEREFGPIPGLEEEKKS